jgi:hypothetical protein
VCIIDAHCCETTWDQVCVDWAQQLCPDCGNPNAKSCCFEHATPFCSDETCCQLVCALDQYCCEDRWDFYCAQSANTNCTITQCTCGDPTAGSCKSAHATAGCSDFRCCNDVCAVDAFCCVVEWDYTCATQAGTICAIFVPSCADSFGSCYVRHNSAGCDEPGCCEQVCAIDSVCCTFEWDAGCVDLAARHCNGCGDIESESCFYPHFGPSCYDPDCCDSVCILDPRCCELQWDMFCVLNAYSVHSSHAHAACPVASQVALTQAAAHSSAISIQPAARARGMKPVQRTRRISAIDHRIAPTAATRSLSILNLAAPMSSAAPRYAKSNPSAANSVGTRTASTSRKASATPSRVALAAASAAFRTHRLVAMTPPAATSSADSIQCAVLRDGM